MTGLMKRWRCVCTFSGFCYSSFSWLTSRSLPSRCSCALMFLIATGVGWTRPLSVSHRCVCEASSSGAWYFLFKIGSPTSVAFRCLQTLAFFSRRCGRCSINRNNAWDTVLVIAQRLLHANNAIWYICRLRQLVECCFNRRVLIVRFVSEWWYIKKYKLVCYGDRCFVYVFIVIVLILFLPGSHSSATFFSNEGQSRQRASTQYARWYATR